jgi:DNA-binding IclR family transcriptional regulator
MKVKVRPSREVDETKSAYKPWVPAVQQASRILFCLAEGPQHKMTLTDICRKAELYKSKGYSILNTLKQFGLVEKDLQTKTYSLGPGLIFLSRSVLDNLNYPEIIPPFLEPLAKETNATAVFGLISGSHVFVVAKREGNQNIGFGLRLGHRFHITLGAHGKAILAFLNETEREKVLSKKNLHFYGDVSRMDVKRLRKEVTTCRRLGFAWDIGEVTPGVNVISAPVFAHHGKIIGCLIVIGTFPGSMIDRHGPKVADIARQISYRLGANVQMEDFTPDGNGFPPMPGNGFEREEAS